MNQLPQLPWGHRSILSPQFRYVPAACTDVAATFARVRAERTRSQMTCASALPPAGWSGGAQEGIEVLEAAWLPGPSCERGPGMSADRRRTPRMTVLSTTR